MKKETLKNKKNKTKKKRKKKEKKRTYRLVYIWRSDYKSDVEAAL